MIDWSHDGGAPLDFEECSAIHYHATAHKEMSDGEAYMLNGIRGLMIILSISPTLGESLTAIVETEG